MRSFRRGEPSSENFHQYEDQNHGMKMFWYICDEWQTLQDVKRMDPPITDSYECDIRHCDLLRPPSSRVLPRIEHNREIPILELARLAVIALPPGHVYRHVEVRSVIIFKDRSIVPNPDGYPPFLILHKLVRQQ